MSWKSIVRAVAPVLGTALGGPFGGAATKFLAGKLLGDENASVSQLEDLIVGASPGTLATIKEHDNEFKLSMRKLDVDIFALDAQNTNSARSMAKVSMLPQVALSTLFVVGYFIIVYFLIITSKELSNSLMLIMGVITAAIPQILNFWFGSTQGSRDKTMLLGRK